MKTIVINTFIILLTLVPFTGFTQETSQTIETQKKEALVSYSLQNEIATYSFSLLSVYDEINTNQHISRIENITQSKITINQKKNKIEVKINSNKIGGDDLDNLLRGLVIINGYSSYKITD